MLRGFHADGNPLAGRCGLAVCGKDGFGILAGDLYRLAVEVDRHLDCGEFGPRSARLDFGFPGLVEIPEHREEDADYEYRRPSDDEGHRGSPRTFGIDVDAATRFLRTDRCEQRDPIVGHREGMLQGQPVTRREALREHLPRHAWR